MTEVIINGKNAKFGRLCSYAARQALEGNEVKVVNSEQVIISGNRKNILEKYRSLRAKGGHSLKGPKISVIAYKILKKGIKGMLPKESMGREAEKRIRCYNGVPEEFKDKKMIEFNEIPRKYIKLNEVIKKI